MSRVLQPHGTEAAYRRHQRAGEEPCPPCREAWSKRRRRQLEEKAARDRGGFSAASSDEPADGPASTPVGFVLPDPLTEARENYRIVVAAMETAPPSAIATLSRQRAELHKSLQRLEDEEARRETLRTAAPTESFESMMRNAGIDL